MVRNEKKKCSDVAFKDCKINNRHFCKKQPFSSKIIFQGNTLKSFKKVCGNLSKDEHTMKVKGNVAKHQSKVTDEKISYNQAKDIKQKTYFHEHLNEHEKTARQRQNKAAMAKSRLKLTDEKKREIQANDRKRKADHLEQLAEHEKKEKQRKNKLAVAKRRLKLLKMIKLKFGQEIESVKLTTLNNWLNMRKRKNKERLN